LNPLKSVYISAPDVYAVIRCEEDSVRTRIFQKDGSPEFNTKAIFYSRNPKSKISIEVRCYTTLYILIKFVYEAKGNCVCWIMHSCGKEACCWTPSWVEHDFRQEEMNKDKTE